MEKTIKRIVAAVLAIIMVLSLTACNGDNNDNNNDNIYTVKFYSNGGNSVPSQTVESGQKVTRPPDPERNRGIFEGWFKESGCQNLWNFETDTVTKNVELYAGWTMYNYNINYYDVGGGEFSGIFYPKTYAAIGANVDQYLSEYYNIGHPVCKPLKDGYTFDGWYTTVDGTGKEVYRFNAKEIQYEDQSKERWNTGEQDEINFYAKWIKKEDVQTYSGATPFHYPSVIASAEEFIKFANTNNDRGYYELACDIDLGGMEWEPMSKYYLGGLNGNGFAVKNFKITQARQDPYTGLFAIVKNIFNLRVEDFVIDLEAENINFYDGGAYIGSLAGWATNVQNCSAKGTITLSGSANYNEGAYLVGGLVGWLGNVDGGLNKDCRSSVDMHIDITSNGVNGISLCAGGLCGLLGGNLSSSYATGEVTVNVTGTYRIYAGGLCGLCGSAAQVFDSYATANLTANIAKGNSTHQYTSYIGGLVGGSGTIQNCYASGNVSATGELLSVGGMSGDDSTRINCFATGDVYSVEIADGFGGSTEKNTNCYRLESQNIDGETVNNTTPTVTPALLNTAVFYTGTLGWDAQTWDLSKLDILNGQYPLLKTQKGEMFTITYRDAGNYYGPTSSNSTPLSGTFPNGGLSEYYIGEITRLPVPVKRGCKFVGWYGHVNEWNSLGGGWETKFKKFSVIDAVWHDSGDAVYGGALGNLTFYAVWEAETYNIKFLDAGGGKFSGLHAAGQLAVHIYGEETELFNPLRREYSFEGWYLDESCSGEAVSSLSATGYLSNITLYAKWSAPQTYNIIYKDFGGEGFSGTFSGSYPTVHTYGTETILRTPLRLGYDFDGWYLSETGSEIGSLSAQGFTSAITVYAKWTKLFNEPSGTVSGIIRDAETSAPLPFAQIDAIRDDVVAGSTTANADGSFSIELPEGNYKLQVSLDGYKEFTINAVAEGDRNINLESFVMVQDIDSSGTVKGRIANSKTNGGLANVTLEVRVGWNTTTGSIVQTIQTNAAGDYTMELPYGYYTVTAIIDGFITVVFNVSVGTNSTVKNYTVSPIDGNDYSIVLTWGERPSDLDSHLVADGTHIYYSNKTSINAWLDVDDINSYGPETITIGSLSALGGFKYCVQDYSNRSSTNSKELSNSGATVRVYKGAELVRTYYVPANQTGTVWNVFEIDANGVITDLNIFENQNDPSSVGR